MSLLVGLRQLGRDLRTQKLRTFLTAFGIVWGTVSVSLLLAFGQGFHQHLRTSQAGLGENILIAWPSRTSLSFEGLGKGRRIRLAEEDMQLVAQKADGLAGICGEFMSSFKMTYGETTLAVDTSGINVAYGDLRNVIARAGGRWINALDMELRRRVIFLGDDLAKSVFGSVDPVGKTVLLHGSPFTVIGVMTTKSQDSSYSGRDKDKAFIPSSTFSAITGRKYVENFIFKAASAERTEGLRAQVLAILAAKHRFDPNDKAALGIWDTTEGFKFLDTFMLAFKSFLGIIGALTLVVGGIGVSNIMNVIVEERTREIGIKMALGARSRSILGQFMVETMALTAVGGAIGLGISTAICAIFPAMGLDEYVGRPTISPFVAVVTAGLLGTIGLLAGYFPARDAASLDPVVAMKL
jgi:putative ABC transport system permease protein